MFYHVREKKIIFLISPKVACSSIKAFFYHLKNIEFLYVHDINIYENSEFFIEGKKVKELLKNNSEYILYVFTRNPYDKFFSGINDKFIRFHPNNHNKQIKNLENNSSSNKIIDFYK